MMGLVVTSGPSAMDVDKGIWRNLGLTSLDLDDMQLAGDLVVICTSHDSRKRLQ